MKTVDFIDKLKKAAQSIIGGWPTDVHVYRDGENREFLKILLVLKEKGGDHYCPIEYMFSVKTIKSIKDSDILIDCFFKKVYKQFRKQLKAFPEKTLFH